MAQHIHNTVLDTCANQGSEDRKKEVEATNKEPGDKREVEATNQEPGDKRQAKATNQEAGEKHRDIEVTNRRAGNNHHHHHGPVILLGDYLIASAVQGIASLKEPRVS